MITEIELDESGGKVFRVAGEEISVNPVWRIVNLHTVSVYTGSTFDSKSSSFKLRSSLTDPTSAARWRSIRHAAPRVRLPVEGPCVSDQGLCYDYGLCFWFHSDLLRLWRVLSLLPIVQRRGLNKPTKFCLQERISITQDPTDLL